MPDGNKKPKREGTKGEHHGPRSPKGSKLIGLSLGALGVVYGDIGTSPLYALRECFHGAHSIVATQQSILGVLSLVFWALMFVIVFKYITFVMRADNHGEGGILALLAVATAKSTSKTGRRTVVILIGLFGTALLYGDGMITPAISVLSAVEGLEVATDAFSPFVVPITIGILLAIFLIQKRGTERVGRIFGPATLLWFVTAFAMGLPWVLKEFDTVAPAVNPYYAAAFVFRAPDKAFLVLGSVVLCITGGEALYADMGHFGRKPIRLAWFAIVFPSLLVNYFGQGALLLHHLHRPGMSRVLESPFYGLVHGYWIYPVIVIATIAAVIASQAMISGAFSITQHAMQLGFSPRVHVVHTSGETEGQIYIGEVNWGLCVSALALVIGFRESTGLAAAYGIAVTGTMVMTSCLFFVVMRERWGALKAGAVVAVFLTVDLTFFSANITKVKEGGWFPLVIALLILVIMTTWKRGREALWQAVKDGTIPFDVFLKDVRERKPHRIDGTAIFMTSHPEGVPPSVLHFFKHTKSLHERVVLLSVVLEHVPHVTRRNRVKIRTLGEGFSHVEAFYGYMQQPRVADIVRQCNVHGLDLDWGETSFFLGRETLLPSGKSGMAKWRKALFAFLSRNARPATAYFGLPANRVVELGMQIEI